MSSGDVVEPSKEAPIEPPDGDAAVLSIEFLKILEIRNTMYENVASDFTETQKHLAVAKAGPHGVATVPHTPDGKADFSEAALLHLSTDEQAKIFSPGRQMDVIIDSDDLPEGSEEGRMAFYYEASATEPGRTTLEISRPFYKLNELDLLLMLEHVGTNGNAYEAWVMFSAPAKALIAAAAAERKVATFAAQGAKQVLSETRTAYQELKAKKSKPTPIEKLTIRKHELDIRSQEADVAFATKWMNYADLEFTEADKAYEKWIMVFHRHWVLYREEDGNRTWFLQAADERTEWEQARDEFMTLQGRIKFLHEASTQAREKYLEHKD